jgi:hypothetical protein
MHLPNRARRERQRGSTAPSDTAQPRTVTPEPINLGTCAQPERALWYNLVQPPSRREHSGIAMFNDFENIEVELAQLQRLVIWSCAALGIATALVIGSLIGGYVQGNFDFLSWGWPAYSAAIVAMLAVWLVIRRALIRLRS